MLESCPGGVEHRDGRVLEAVEEAVHARADVLRHQAVELGRVPGEAAGEFVLGVGEPQCPGERTENTAAGVRTSLLEALDLVSP